jgi:uncharacterized protein (TIGR02757 family)
VRNSKLASLKRVLDAFVETRPWPVRIEADPIEFPHRFTNPRDIEVVGLLSTALAYGKVSLFKPKIAQLLDGLGTQPARTVASLDLRELTDLTRGFVYRFNTGADLACLLSGMGRCLEIHGSLEAGFLDARRRASDWREALSLFSRDLRAAAPQREIEKRLGPCRGLQHLLPSGDGVAKRLNLYLRWMVRPNDGIDFGIWKNVSPSQLMIPLDTHVARLGHLLGFTERTTLTWKTVEDITAALRLLDPTDPTRYDFALCHYGMSGACPRTSLEENCLRCPLKGECRKGRALVSEEREQVVLRQ